MSNEIENRVLSLEFRADAHEKELGVLQATGDTLRKSLQGVENTLLQIKWLAMGAIGVLVANEFGILTALKVVFGVG